MKAVLRTLQTSELFWLASLTLILLLRFPVNYVIWPPYLMDFEVYRSVSVRILQEGAARLYDPTTSELMMFKYAPCWALFWLPLGWMSSHLGGVFWAAITVVWLTLACWGTDRLCARAGLRVPPWVTAVTVSLLVRPVTAEFLNGQVDIFWGLLVIAFLLAETSSRRWASALWLSLAISLKVPAAIFLPYLALRGRWSTVWRTIVLTAGINLVTSLLLWPSHPLALFGIWAEVLRSSGIARAFEIGNQSFLALLGRFLTADQYQLHVATLTLQGVLLVFLGLSLILFALVTIGPRDPTTATRRLIFDGALLTVLMVLCSPTTWIATYSALLFPLTLALAGVVSHPRTLRRPEFIVLWLLILGTSIMTHSGFWRAIGLRSFRHESYVYLVLMVLPWFGLTLFALLWLQRHAHRAAGAHS